MLNNKLIRYQSSHVISFLFMQQELDNDMRKCKEEFKEFERQDVKYREDFKHLNQKIKKLEDKVEKVRGRHGLLHLKVYMHEMPYPFVPISGFIKI